MQYLFVFCFVFLASCGGVKKIPLEESTYPQWITNRPISSDTYIGIGKALKNIEDYRAIAKQNALTDLSSEISVLLSSESIFHQVDKGDSYREDYQSLIQVESKKELEGYTQLASWENNKEYWVYYQLSKSEWNNLRKTRREQVVKDAYSYYKVAEKYLVEQDVSSAVFYAVKALDALRLYMNEPINHPDFEVPLDVICFQFLADIHSSVTYEVILGQQYRNIVLMGTDISLESFDVSVGKSIIPFKIRSSFRGVPNLVYSDDEGFVKIRVQGMDVYKKEHFIQFTLDWDLLVAEANASPWLRSFIDFPDNSFKITVNTIWPSIYISSEELNLGKEMSQSILLNETINYFTAKGFYIGTADEADFSVYIKANTDQGLTNNKIYTSMLAYEFIVKDSVGKVIYQQQEREIKGVQANFSSAGINAYERSLDDFKWDVLRRFFKFLEGE